MHFFLFPFYSPIFQQAVEYSCYIPLFHYTGDVNTSLFGLLINVIVPRLSDCFFVFIQCGLQMDILYVTEFYICISACLINFLLLYRSKLLGDKSRFLCQDTFIEFSGVSFNVSKCKGYNVWTRDRSDSVFLPYNPIKSDWIVTVNPVRLPDINPKKRFFYLPRLLCEFW